MALHMRLLIGCTVVHLFTGTDPARAEFQLSGQSGPSTVREELPEAASEPTLPRFAPALRRIAVATGFGRQVPLSFALRQIVPKGVTVLATDDIDIDAVLVDWVGGRPWPDVVREALRGPGLRATVKPGSLLIEHATP